MVLLIPDAVRKIKAQGRAEGYAEGYVLGRVEAYVQNRVEAWAQGRAEDRQKARQLIWDAVLEYCRREGMGEKDPIPLSVALDIIDETIPRNTTAPRR